MAKKKPPNPRGKIFYNKKNKENLRISVKGIHFRNVKMRDYGMEVQLLTIPD